MDLGDPDLSNNIAKYVAEHPRLSGHAGSVTVPAFIESLDCYESCKPLVDAVNRICSWQDVLYIMFINVNPGTSPIHQDSLTHHDYFWALNIPILNCKDSCTLFFEPLPREQGIVPSLEIAESSVGIGADGYRLWQPNQVKEIDRMHLTQPMLFNISSIHCVHNPTNQPRLSLSIRMNCDILEKYNIAQK